MKLTLYELNGFKRFDVIMDSTIEYKGWITRIKGNTLTVKPYPSKTKYRLTTFIKFTFLKLMAYLRLY